jgi:hypothetical protein
MRSVGALMGDELGLCGLLRISLPQRWVNKGERKGRGISLRPFRQLR